ncbi:MFS transporter [Candidatus Bathyarchaeota archaeon]|nr:MFS transporter [Candidatus Bathyarchaeota archaeon]
MTSSINVAIPLIEKDLNVNAALLNWISLSYLLSAAVFLVPFGKIADIYGRKKIFKIGILIYMIASILSSFSTSFLYLISFRVLQGLGGAMILSAGVAILTSIFPIGERGRILGINVAAVYLGLSFGPFLGGFLTQNLGWRILFLLNAPLAALIIFLIYLKLRREWVEAKEEGFDLIGSLIYGFMLTTMLCGLSFLSKKIGVLMSLISFLSFLIFIKFEAKIENPILNINLFRENKVFIFSNLATLINYSATFAVSFLLSLYLQYIKSLNPQDTGLILAFQPIIQALFSPTAGKLSDKIEPRIIASIGMSLTFISLFSLSFLSNESSLNFILINLILLGLSFALFASPNTNAVMSSVEKRFYGVASATLATMRLIGQSLSMSITGLTFTIYIGEAEITIEKYQILLNSIKMLFMFFSFLCFAGIFASLKRGKLRH